MFKGVVHLNCDGLSISQMVYVQVILQKKQVPLPESCVQAVNKLTPPFLKSIVRSGYFQTAAGLLCLCLCGFSMEREGKGKVSVQPLHGPHSVQPQEPGG